jgi:hypothetical protein
MTAIDHHNEECLQPAANRVPKAQVRGEGK